MKPKTFDYESHKDWAERVPDVRRDYKPDRPNGAAIFAGAFLAGIVLLLAVCWTLLLTGVLTWR